MLAAGGLPLVAASARGDTPIGELEGGAGRRIKGEVTQVFGNAFVLAAGSGRVLVETASEWFQRHRVTVGWTLVVTGATDDGAFDAFTLTRADGSVSTIRPAAGPPPWAGRDRPRPTMRPPRRGRPQGRPGSGSVTRSTTWRMRPARSL